MLDNFLGVAEETDLKMFGEILSPQAQPQAAAVRQTTAAAQMAEAVAIERALYAELQSLVAQVTSKVLQPLITFFQEQPDRLNMNDYKATVRKLNTEARKKLVQALGKDGIRLLINHAKFGKNGRRTLTASATRIHGPARPSIDLKTTYSTAIAHLRDQLAKLE